MTAMCFLIASYWSGARAGAWSEPGIIGARGGGGGDPGGGISRLRFLRGSIGGAPRLTFFFLRTTPAIASVVVPVAVAAPPLASADLLPDALGADGFGAGFAAGFTEALPLALLAGALFEVFDFSAFAIAKSLSFAGS